VVSPGYPTNEALVVCFAADASVEVQLCELGR